MLLSGLNFRLNDFQSALGISQLKKIKKFVKKRNLISSHYNNELKKVELKLEELMSKSLPAVILDELKKEIALSGYKGLPISQQNIVDESKQKIMKLWEVEKDQLIRSLRDSEMLTEEKAILESINQL